jgi:hypothetical protein
MLFAGLVGTASAGPLVGKDGKIHACYKVKGKPKGAMRVLFKPKKKCRRGERKVAWIAAAPTAGSTGQEGQSGAAGSQGGSDPALSAKVSTLALRVDGLEGVLDGVRNGDLTGALSTLDGVTGPELSGALDTVDGLTNTELTDAVDTMPVVDSLCDQTSALTDQVNLLRTAIAGLGLNPILEGLGGLLEIPILPPAVDPFACSVP